MQLDGSDAMNPDPDYSAAYCILETDQAGLTGHGLTFTIGRANDICCAPIAALAPLVEGLDLDWIAEDCARFCRHLTRHRQLPFICPANLALHPLPAPVLPSVLYLLLSPPGPPLFPLFAPLSPP